MDFIKSILPPGQGILPYYMLVVSCPLPEAMHRDSYLRRGSRRTTADWQKLSVVSIGNSLQAYLTLHFSRRVYNGRFVPNPQLKKTSDGVDPEDRTDKLVPATNPKDPKAADQLTPLAGRLFGTWTLITCIVRCYAAYHLHIGPVYNIAIWTYVVALGHFASELFVFKSMSFGVPQLFPFCLATTALIWMPMVRDHYVEFN